MELKSTQIHRVQCHQISCIYAILIVLPTYTDPLFSGCAPQPEMLIVHCHSITDRIAFLLSNNRSISTSPSFLPSTLRPPAALWRQQLNSVPRNYAKQATRETPHTANLLLHPIECERRTNSANTAPTFLRYGNKLM